jgi:lysyl-tRNA synthetase class II
MKKFLVHIWAYSHHASFEVMAEDTPESVENAILDKVGEKSIKWENLGVSYDSRIKRITFEEVINDTRPIQTKKVLGVEVGTRVY